MWYFVIRVFVAFGEGHPGVGNVRQQRGLGACRSAGLRGKVRRNVGDIVGAELGRNRIHDGRRTRRTRLLARAVLERLQLRLEVARPLPREIGNVFAHAHAVCAMACRANGGGHFLAGLDIRGVCNLCNDQNN